MKTVALITEYGNVNIGNKLQNYAVKVLCEERNWHPVTFEYKSDYEKIKNWQRIIAFLGLPKSRAIKYRMKIKRTKRFKQFSDTYLGEIIKVEMNRINKELIDRFDLFLVGSDQVWHEADNIRLDYFFLKFAPKDKRACISPSFGTDYIHDNYKAIYIDGLLGFNDLCCREIQGCQIIKDLTGKEAELLCDPTLLVGRRVWDNIALIPKIYPSKDYVLVYFLGETDNETNEIVNNYAKKNDLDIVRIYSFDHPDYYSISPNEFIYLVKNARIIMTDSFHGTVFSIIYEKRFMAFKRMNKDGRAIMSSRIETLVDKFELVSKDSERLYVDAYDHDNIERILNNEILKVKSWLDKYN